jgi:hypothetical protein
MIDEGVIRRLEHSKLVEARNLAHLAVQHVTRAARANLPSVPDDSHSNLSWVESRGTFVSQPLPGRHGPLRVGFSIVDFELLVLRDGAPERWCRLDGARDVDIAARLDEFLQKEGLERSASVVLPYDLPAEMASIDAYTLAGLEDEIEGLAIWYGLAAASISALASQCGDIRPGPSPLRCWPHHFDIAVYLSLEDGDAETARGIGIGMSPGDESYGEPYFYVNPWPYPDPALLPPAPVPGHWHVDGFVGAIATASELLTCEDLPRGLSAFIGSAVSVGRQAFQD